MKTTAKLTAFLLCIASKRIGCAVEAHKNGRKTSQKKKEFSMIKSNITRRENQTIPNQNGIQKAPRKSLKNTQNKNTNTERTKINSSKQSTVHKKKKHVLALFQQLWQLGGLKGERLSWRKWVKERDIPGTLRFLPAYCSWPGQMIIATSVATSVGEKNWMSTKFPREGLGSTHTDIVLQ